MAVVIGIGGGSGSGKTALAERLAAALGPGRARLLSEDHYYLDAGGREDLIATPDAIDFDDIASKDWPLLAAHLVALKRGEAINQPLYDFVTHRRKAETERFAPAAFVILEGINALYDARIRAACDLTVFVDTPEAVRLARRIRRDCAERGRDPDEVRRRFYGHVSRGQRLFVEPQRALADMVIVDAGPAEATLAEADAHFAAAVQSCLGAIRMRGL